MDLARARFRLPGGNILKLRIVFADGMRWP